MSEFMDEPSMVLEGIEGVRAALADTSWKSKPHPFQYRVKSDWLISLIDEIAKKEYPYNATVKRVARERLGLPALSEKENAQEGDALSTLIYNAQKYRRSDQLLALGFVPLTQDLIEEAFASGRSVELKGGTLCKVREVEGKRYLFQPRKRVYAVLPNGGPVRLA